MGFWIGFVLGVLVGRSGGIREAVNSQTWKDWRVARDSERGLRKLRWITGRNAWAFWGIVLLGVYLLARGSVEDE